MSHGEIDLLPGEVDVVQGGGDAKVNLGMGLRETAEAIDQPFGREIRRGADGEDAS